MMKKRTLEEWVIFVHNVAWLQEQHKLSDREMSKKLGISPPTLAKIKNGELPPRLGVEILFYIQKEFNIAPASQFVYHFGE